MSGGKDGRGERHWGIATAPTTTLLAVRGR
jgi:hypothetical protein